MTMYVSKAWGWVPAGWPVVAFRHDATRQRLRKRWNPGDTMLIVVTETEQADIGLRGRMAGWYVFSDREVRTADVVGPTARWDLDPERRPYGLLAHQAFSIDDPLMFKAFLPHVHERNLGFRIVTAFAELTPAEEEQVLGLLLTRFRCLSASRLLKPRPGRGSREFGSIVLVRCRAGANMGRDARMKEGAPTYSNGKALA
jgi:hypothetical protein